MQIEFFLNRCQDIIKESLLWLSNPELQRETWFRINPPTSTFDEVVEGFMADVEDLFETKEYKYFANKPACILLKELHQKVETYDFDMDSVVKKV